MPTLPATAQIAPAVRACAADIVLLRNDIPPEDRLPTFAELDAFDANAAWDRLSPAEQRRVGIMAVRLGVMGQRLNFEHSDWTHDQVRLMEVRESDELEAFNNAVELLWQVLFGWVRPHWAKPLIREVA